MDERSQAQGSHLIKANDLFPQCITPHRQFSEHIGEKNTTAAVELLRHDGSESRGPVTKHSRYV